jgi:hypothetical protein
LSDPIIAHDTCSRCSGSAADDRPDPYHYRGDIPFVRFAAALVTAEIGQRWRFSEQGLVVSTYDAGGWVPPEVNGVEDQEIYRLLTAVWEEGAEGLRCYCHGTAAEVDLVKRELQFHLPGVGPRTEWDCCDHHDYPGCEAALGKEIAKRLSSTPGGHYWEVRAELLTWHEAPWGYLCPDSEEYCQGAGS